MRGVLVPIEASCPTLHMILRAIVPGPTATDGGSAVEARRVVTLHCFHPVVTVGHPIAGRLIARSHHHKRGVMAVGIHNPLRLLQQILVDLLPATQFHTVIRPRGSLGLKIDSKLVGCGKGGLRRTIGMEAYMIQTVFPDLRQDAHPRLLVRWRIAGLGKTAVLYGAAKPHRTVVDIQLTTLDTDLPHAEGGLVVVIAHADT